MANCKFDIDLNIRLRDQFEFGLRSEVAQKQLFAKPDEITLEEVVALATAQVFRAKLVACSWELPTKRSSQ